MNFSDALHLMKQKIAGSINRMTRKGWNGKNQWIRYYDPYLDEHFKIIEEPGSEGTWLPFLIIKTVDNKLVPWLASQTDLLANDWQVENL